MGENFRHLTLQVIAEALLSISPEESDSTFAKMYLPIVTEGNLRTWYPYRAYLPFLPSFWKHRQNVKTLNDYISSIIEKRWTLRQEERHAEMTLGIKRGRREDILDRIISHIEPKETTASIQNKEEKNLKGGKGENKEQNINTKKLDRRTLYHLRDQLKTFILAGHETSASMLTWALLEVIQNKELLKVVRQEADTVFGPEKIEDLRAERPLNREKLRGLDVTEMCLKEALRKYSVVPIVVRETNKDVTLLQKHFIPKGTRVMILIQGVHSREDLWPDNHTFNPYRFTQKLKPFTFIPFIDGPRNCLGQHLALLETKIVLATLVQQLDLTFAPECNIKYIQENTKDNSNTLSSGESLSSISEKKHNTKEKEPNWKWSNWIRNGSHERENNEKSIQFQKDMERVLQNTAGKNIDASALKHPTMVPVIPADPGLLVYVDHK